MKRKPIRIDWEALEDAFSGPADEADSYLDRVTGHVVLEGEAEDDDRDEDEMAHANPTAVARRSGARRRDDPTLLPIRPPETARKIEWLRAFLQDGAGEFDAGVVGELERAMDSEHPARAISAVLNANPAIRDEWYLYRSDRLHELIDAWLDEHGIEPADPAPWTP